MSFNFLIIPLNAIFSAILILISLFYISIYFLFSRLVIIGSPSFIPIGFLVFVLIAIKSLELTSRDFLILGLIIAKALAFLVAILVYCPFAYTSSRAEAFLFLSLLLSLLLLSSISPFLPINYIYFKYSLLK
jgi:hypothetical protein